MTPERHFRLRFDVVARSFSLILLDFDAQKERTMKKDLSSEERQSQSEEEEAAEKKKKKQGRKQVQFATH